MDETSNQLILQILTSINNTQEVILENIKDLKKEIQKNKEIEETHWKENNKRWEENNRRWDENDKRWEENERRWKENDKRWDENEKRWDENKKLWIKYEKNRKEDISSISKIIYDHEIYISSALGDPNTSKMKKIN